MRSIPATLWEIILRLCPFNQLPEATKRAERVGGLSKEDWESITHKEIRCIFLQEWQDSLLPYDVSTIFPMIKSLSEDSYIIYNQCNDWGPEYERLVVFRGGATTGDEAPVPIIEKKHEDRIKDEKEESMGQVPHPSRELEPVFTRRKKCLPLVDRYLPSELLRYRPLIRPHSEFTMYTDARENLPKGYDWYVIARTPDEFRITDKEDRIKCIQEMIIY